MEDILSPGDIVGEGALFQSEALRLVPHQSPEQPRVADYVDPAREFEVVRKLGVGSYTNIYLVREVLSRSLTSEDDPIYPGGYLELDDAAPMRLLTEYGREYAIKLLPKAEFDEEELVAHLTEVRVCYLYFFPALKILLLW
jgi:serine/threonine protein kinase